MYATRSPAYQSQSPQPVSADWDSWYERPFDVNALPQYLDLGTSLATVCPEATLMCAVLEDAFFCFKRQFETEKRCAPHTAQDAEEWFFSDDSHDLFSFVSICTVLGLEPEFIRKGLKHWSQSRLHRPKSKQRKMQRHIAARQAPSFFA